MLEDKELPDELIDALRDKSLTLDEVIDNLTAWLVTAIEDSFGPTDVETFRVAIKACKLMRNGATDTPIADDIYCPEVGSQCDDLEQITHFFQD